MQSILSRLKLALGALLMVAAVGTATALVRGDARDSSESGGGGDEGSRVATVVRAEPTATLPAWPALTFPERLLNYNQVAVRVTVREVYPERSDTVRGAVPTLDPVFADMPAPERHIYRLVSVDVDKFYQTPNVDTDGFVLVLYARGVTDVPSTFGPTIEIARINPQDVATVFLQPVGPAASRPIFSFALAEAARLSRRSGRVYDGSYAVTEWYHHELGKAISIAYGELPLVEFEQRLERYLAAESYR
jgi:hypothetical protein